MLETARRDFDKVARARMRTGRISSGARRSLTPAGPLGALPLGRLDLAQAADGGEVVGLGIPGVGGEVSCRPAR